MTTKAKADPTPKHEAVKDMASAPSTALSDRIEVLERRLDTLEGHLASGDPTHIAGQYAKG